MVSSDEDGPPRVPRTVSRSCLVEFLRFLCTALAWSFRIAEVDLLGCYENKANVF